MSKTPSLPRHMAEELPARPRLLCRDSGQSEVSPGNLQCSQYAWQSCIEMNFPDPSFPPNHRYCREPTLRAFFRQDLLDFPIIRLLVPGIDRQMIDFATPAWIFFDHHALQC